MAIKEKILINVTPRETRVAIIENEMLQELHFERVSTRGLVGNIYKAKVLRVLPGMQAAFVDIGQDKNGFLHARDISHRQSSGASSNKFEEKPSVQDLVHEGQWIYVQVIKEPIGDKGARLTSKLSMPSRNLVYFPDGSDVAISQKIESPQERARLTELLQSLMSKYDLQGGFIIRTAAESVPDQDIATDLLFLKRIWESRTKAMKVLDTIGLVHQDLPLLLRALRDLAHDDLEAIVIDSHEAMQQAEEFALELMPEVVNKLQHYSDQQGLFSLYSVEQEIQNAVNRNITLDSGGVLVFDKTEAMTTIDVNTGSFVGKRSVGNTLLKTNLEAATEIARQLRLRNLAGIIIIDFIDMQNAQHKKQVMAELERGLAKDRVKTSVYDFSPLGLIEMTRERTRESLENVLCEPCHVCLGRGTIKTAQTVCYEILREILTGDQRFKARAYTVVASPIVIDLMLDEEADSLEKLQSYIERPIALQSDPHYQQSQYDIALN